LITCHLTKLETALEQVRKAYPKLKPTDAALMASALTLTGRHAIALYEGNQYVWPEDYTNLTKAMVGQLEMVNEGIETTKKAVKGAPEEEPVHVTVGLMPNISAGEKQLSDRKDLKTLLSDMIQEGVEFVYAPIDIGWQWALERANWNTISDQDISRRIKVKASFTEGAVGIEMGAAGPKRRASRAKAAAVAEAADAPDEEVAEPEAETVEEI
jgi:hypothetical protein